MNDQEHNHDSIPFAELVGSLGLSQEQQVALLDGYRRDLADQEQRVRAELDIQHTGLGPAPGATILPLREAVRRHLTAALERTRGKIYGPDGAAKLLDLKPTTLQSKLKKHGVDRLGAAASTSGAPRGGANSSESEGREASESEGESESDPSSPSATANALDQVSAA